MSRRLVPIEDKPGLYRDLDTRAVVNMSDEAYAAFKKSKQAALKRKELEEAKEARINKIEQDVRELKAGIDKILQILSNGNT